MKFYVMPGSKIIYRFFPDNEPSPTEWSNFVSNEKELTAQEARKLYYKKHKMDTVYNLIRGAITCGERQVIIDMDSTTAEILRSDGYAIRCVNSEEFDNRTTGYVVSW